MKIHLWENETFPDKILKQVGNIEDSDPTTCLKLNISDIKSPSKEIVLIITLPWPMSSVGVDILEDGLDCDPDEYHCSETPLLIVMPYGYKQGDTTGQKPCHPFCGPVAICEYEKQCSYVCNCPEGGCNEIVIVKNNLPANKTITICDIMIRDITNKETTLPSDRAFEYSSMYCVQ